MPNAAGRGWGVMGVYPVVVSIYSIPHSPPPQSGSVFYQGVFVDVGPLN